MLKEKNKLEYAQMDWLINLNCGNIKCGTKA